MSRGDKRIFTTSLSIDLLNRFRTYCQVTNGYQNKIIETLLEDFLDQNENTTRAEKPPNNNVISLHLTNEPSESIPSTKKITTTDKTATSVPVGKEKEPEGHSYL